MEMNRLIYVFKGIIQLRSFGLNQLRYDHSVAFRAVELRRIRDIIEDNSNEFLEAWNEYFVQ